MRIKVLYRKNLKMTSPKLASQVAHAVKNLGSTPIDSDIVVLMASNKKFDEKIKELDSSDKIYYIQVDKGLTEVEQGTATAVAWIE